MLLYTLFLIILITIENTSTYIFLDFITKAKKSVTA